MSGHRDPFNAFRTLEVGGRTYKVADLHALEEQGLCKLAEMPVSIRVVLESILRNVDGEVITEEDVRNAASWKPDVPDVAIPFMPSRVVLQDFTGVPAVVDLAAMRDSVARLGANATAINPLVPCDLVIDHSVQVDYYGAPNAYDLNVGLEYTRNSERYKLIKWGQKAFKNFRAVPPGTGIIHQVNLEYLASVVHGREFKGDLWAYPDTCVGTDSHTTMIGGVGVVGWGVGGIEAEAVMLGQPYFMNLPEVIGVRLTGELPEGATATDLVLLVTERLRKVGVVEKFVEFFGPGLSQLTLADRATIANMAPEQGSTISFFPVDEKTLEYLDLSAREKHQIELVKAYSEMQGIFGSVEPKYTKVVDIDLSTVEPSLAGPKRPQDRVAVKNMRRHFRGLVKERYPQAAKDATKRSLERWLGEGGHPDDLPEGSPHHAEPDLGHLTKQVDVKVSEDHDPTALHHGSAVIAAITSCTNTSNPSVMIGAGLVAKKAIEKGLTVSPIVKTSLAPGSRVVTEYLKKAGLLEYLEQLRFHTVGYGCTTCIGNSGPLPEVVEEAIEDHDLLVASVLSGNRNFEARIHPNVRANYLASPPLVVAYALAGRVDIDLDKEPLGVGKDGQPVYLADIWPTNAEVGEALKTALDATMFKEKYATVFEGDERWQALPTSGGEVYEWSDESTYIRNPPFFEGITLDEPKPKDIHGARALALLGDTVTTDHISPAGSIPKDYPAGKWLIEHGVTPENFNTYGTRRGNHEVMMRGTFGNVRIKNLLTPGLEGSFTKHIPSGEQTYIYDAAMRYKAEGTPLVVVAGKEYGTGSSRDWAAKGTALLGVKAVLVESFERIHRNNLVGMGVLPLQFKPGESAQTHGLDGTEAFSITGIEEGLTPGKTLHVKAEKENGETVEFDVDCRLDTPAEVLYYRNGGILHTVLRRLANTANA